MSEPRTKANRVAAAALLFFSFPFALLARTPELPQMSGFTRHVEAISSFYPRTEGSTGEAETLQYITEQLRGEGIPHTVRSLAEVERGHSFSSSVYVHIPGRSQAGDELVFVAPLNHPQSAKDGADGSANIALGLVLAAHFSRTKPAVTLRILFLGAEFGDGVPYPIGTQHFLDSFFPDQTVVVFYSLFAFVPDRVIIRSGDSGHVSPYWLTESCASSLDESDVFHLFRGNENQFYRMGMAENPAPLGPYLNASYPALSFHIAQRPLPAAEHDAWAARFVRFMTTFLDEHASGFPKQWDRHYLFFQARGFSLILKEESYLLIVVLLVSLMILYPLIVPERFHNYTRSLMRDAWALPVLLGLSFGLLFLGTLILEGAFALKRFPSVWRYKPFPFYALKLSAAVFLFTLLYRFLKRIPFPRRGRFYNAAALLVLVLDIIVLGIINISLAYYVVWAALWAFLFSLAPNRFLKSVCWLISPLWFVKAVYDVFTLPELNIAEAMLLGRVSGNLVSAIILLPFLLMLIRLDFMFRHPRRRTKKVLMTVVFSVLGFVVSGLLVYAVIYWPFSSEQPQPITAKELIDLTNDEARVIVAGPAPLGLVTVLWDGKEETFSTGSNRLVLESTPNQDLLRVRGAATRFLGRKQFSVVVDSIGTPEEIDISLSAPVELVLYDSNFPYTYREINEITIHIGRNPPLPLNLRFTVPGAQTGTLGITAAFNDPPGQLAVRANNISLERAMTVTRVLQLDDLD